MTRLALRNGQFASLKAIVAHSNMVNATQQDVPVPGDVATWLGDLAVLKGVPFGYLVPDDAMLPTESIRFFVLDPNWVNALLEGAASIGRSCSLEASVDAALVSRLYAAVAPTNPVTGFVLRSNVVSGWPGIEVRAYDSSGRRLNEVLRHEILAPTVMLFMVSGAIDHVDISEPAEALHFGIDIEQNRKGLRYVTAPSGASAGPVAGEEIAGVSAPVSYRAAGGGKRVLKVSALAASVETALTAAKANLDPVSGRPRPFTAAEFALELVEGVQSVRFVNINKEG